MQLVKRWYEPARRRNFEFPGRVLKWEQSVDGRAYLVSDRTFQAYVARFVWARWHRWVMQGRYYPLIRTLEDMGILVWPDGVYVNWRIWRTFSVRGRTIHARLHEQRHQSYQAGWRAGYGEARDEMNARFRAMKVKV